MSIVLEHLTKRYEGVPVVNDISLEIRDGEFFVLLGPSGSGKSTILRMIAGLNAVDSGRVMLHGRDVTRLPPQQRDTGFVFQHYALFRHMSVAENIEFGLRVRKMPVAQRRRRRDELLDLVGLAGLGNRMPHQLSGGQQQRIALARALAPQPTVLLLDEPFGALDAKIRVELRRSLRAIQRNLKVTTIFVTHDQEEGFELADRVGVMNVGRLLEVGSPDELYLRPQTEFVATFLGSANLLVGQCTQDSVQVGPLHFPLSTETVQGSDVQRVQVLFRPEDVALAPTANLLADPPLGRAEVEQNVFVGAFERLRLRLPPIPGVRPIAPPTPFGSDFVLIDASRSQDQALHFPLQPGDQVWVGVRRVHALAHPGLNILLVSDGLAAGQAALTVGGQIARLAHARVTILGYGAGLHKGATTDKEEVTPLQSHLQKAKEEIGAGLAALDMRTTSQPPHEALAWELEQHPYDLVVLGSQSHGNEELIERLIQIGEHHLLIVPRTRPVPSRVLICVAAGEPGKEDIRFAGRLIRHLGAKATLLSVLTDNSSTPQYRERSERFLVAGARTLESLGVSAQTVTRTGSVRDQIMAEIREGGYDLLVLGAPLPQRDGRATLGGVVGQILSDVTEFPVLIVRSAYAANIPHGMTQGRINIIEQFI